MKRGGDRWYAAVMSVLTDPAGDFAIGTLIFINF